jgi:hypothetical protein
VQRVPATISRCTSALVTTVKLGRSQVGTQVGIRCALPGSVDDVVIPAGTFRRTLGDSLRDIENIAQTHEERAHQTGA